MWKGIVIGLGVLLAGAALWIAANPARTIEFDTHTGRFRTRSYLFDRQWNSQIESGPLTPLLTATPPPQQDWQFIDGSTSNHSTNYKWRPLYSDLLLVAQSMDAYEVSNPEQRRVLTVLLDACRSPGRVHFTWDDMREQRYTVRDDENRVIVSVQAVGNAPSPHILPPNARP